MLFKINFPYFHQYYMILESKAFGPIVSSIDFSIEFFQVDADLKSPESP